MLSNLRHVLIEKTWRSVCDAIFESHFYTPIVWAQNTNPIKRFHSLQENSRIIMFFQS